MDDALAALEDVANGDGIATWGDVEEFFRTAAFDAAFDLPVGDGGLTA